VDELVLDVWLEVALLLSTLLSRVVTGEGRSRPACRSESADTAAAPLLFTAISLHPSACSRTPVCTRFTYARMHTCSRSRGIPRTARRVVAGNLRSVRK